MKNLHFKIIVPLYNVEEWINKCLYSIKLQTYDNFQCVLIDDISTDRTIQKIEKVIQGDDRFLLVKNTQKKLALKNIYDGIKLSQPDKEDVIVTLDGDDWFASQRVLERLNREYTEQDCWLTYGSYIEYPSKKIGKFAQQIPANIIQNNLLRKYRWCSSHLRTFKYHLWQKIKTEDFLDTNGGFYEMAWDLSFMFPMLEMAGDRSRYIKDILYMYNVSNPLNDHKKDNSLQRKLEMEIRNKPPYKQIYLLNNETNDLLNFRRFDIASKIIFAKHYLKNGNSSFPKQVYLENLKVWNNFKEKSPVKNGPQDFLKSFKDTIESIKDNGFLSGSEIPLLNNSPINGAHRVAASIALNKKVLTRPGNSSEGQYMCDYNYFMNKRNFVPTGLKQYFADEMALEFCKNKNNLYCVCLFPSHQQPIEKIIELIKNTRGVIYKKNIRLSNYGKINFMHNLYLGEHWLGTKEGGLPGAKEKAKLCFSQGSEVVVVLIEEDEPENLIHLKEDIRKVCRVGKHSVHINDTQNETWRIASSVFNKNSLHLLNNRDPFSNTEKFDNFFNRYTNLVGMRLSENYCIDSSAVLSVYGLRDCRDLDYIHFDGLRLGDKEIDCHNSELHHYTVDKDDILFDPKNHFYFCGYKFASLQVVYEMKSKRNEEKDRVDIKLINKIKQEQP